MLKWMDQYYVSKRIRHPEKIQEKISNGKAVPGIYLVTLSHNAHNLCEIVPAVVLTQSTARRNCPEIIGMALGHEDAVYLVRDLLLEVYDRTGSYEISSFLKGQVSL